jgi:sugar O-acyltransferase (sialic acid O-acetyltransferase NeuD family)
MNDLIIYGAGAIGKFVAYNLDLFEGSYNLLGFVDNDDSKAGGRLCGLPVMSRDYLTSRDVEDLCVVIAISRPAAKAHIAEKLLPRGVMFPNFVARGAWLSRGVILGHGVLVYPGSSIDHETEIGNFVTINAGCAIGHNARLGDYATISPGVCLGGHTTVGRGAFLGIGCCTKQGVEIGARSVVGGQAMLIGDVGPEKTVVGVPGKVK